MDHYRKNTNDKAISESVLVTNVMFDNNIWEHYDNLEFGHIESITDWTMKEIHENAVKKDNKVCKN